MTSPQHVYEVRPRKDKRGVDLISDALPFGRLVFERYAVLDLGKSFAAEYFRAASTPEQYPRFPAGERFTSHQSTFTFTLTLGSI